MVEASLFSEQSNGLVGLALSPLAKLAHFDTTKGEQTIVGFRPCKTKCGTSNAHTPYKEGLARAATFVHFGD